jgi:hypothetical protein
MSTGAPSFSAAAQESEPDDARHCYVVVASAGVDRLTITERGGITMTER